MTRLLRKVGGVVVDEVVDEARLPHPEVVERTRVRDVGESAARLLLRRRTTPTLLMRVKALAHQRQGQPLV